MSREEKRLLGKQWNRQLANQPKRKNKMKRSIESYNRDPWLDDGNGMDTGNDLHDDFDYSTFGWDDLDDMDYVDDFEGDYLDEDNDY